MLFKRNNVTKEKEEEEEEKEEEKKNMKGKRNPPVFMRSRIQTSKLELRIAA